MTETDTTKTVRVFFALWPDDNARNALAAWQPQLHELCGGRATPAIKLHNTLVFLGEVETERLEALKLAAEEVCGEAFQIVFDVARYWGHNHIVYAAPAVVPEKLMRLASEMEQTLKRHHFNFDKRAYKPHVTLLRHAHWSDTPLPQIPPVKCSIDDFALVQSISADQGVRYEVLEKFPLSGRHS